MTEDDAGAVLRELSARLARLEDRQSIVHLVTGYGPAVDSGDADAVARIWTADGIYDVDTGILRGHDEIRQMVRGERHQGYITEGCAHILEPAHVVIDGDGAVATGKSMLVVGSEDHSGFVVLRTTANRWELTKNHGQWKCQRRIGRVLDGRPEARQLLAAGIPGPDGSLPRFTMNSH